MLKFDELQTIYLEITNKCQAACPMCSRNYCGGLPNPNLKLNDWSLEDFRKIITPKVLSQINLLSFIGNFGDCIINHNFLDMCKELTNVDIELHIYTNGSAKTTEWWRELATIVPKQHSVIFAIDGLEDTHSIYRIGTDYNKIINNAKAFIDAGGIAEWAMIRFNHNAHQVDAAKQLSKELGFRNFSLKDSNRFKTNTQEVVDKTGNLLYTIKPYSNTEVKALQEEDITEFYNIYKDLEIDCETNKYKQIYIDCHKDLYPCCFTAAIPYDYFKKEEMLYSSHIKAKEQSKSIIEKIGGQTKINALNRTIKSIIEDPKWISAWHQSWNQKDMIICSKICGKCNITSSSMEQYIDV